MAGLTIIDVKIVGLCSQCRKEGDEIPKYKDGTIVPDKDISCLSDAFGQCNNPIYKKVAFESKEEVKENAN